MPPQDPKYSVDENALRFSAENLAQNAETYDSVLSGGPQEVPPQYQDIVDQLGVMGFTLIECNDLSLRLNEEQNLWDYYYLKFEKGGESVSILVSQFSPYAIGFLSTDNSLKGLIINTLYSSQIQAIAKIIGIEKQDIEQFFKLLEVAPEIFPQRFREKFGVPLEQLPKPIIITQSPSLSLEGMPNSAINILALLGVQILITPVIGDELADVIAEQTGGKIQIIQTPNLSEDTSQLIQKAILRAVTPQNN